MPKWEKLGAGSYNTAYKSEDGKLVLKIRHDTSVETDTPDRSVRLWNEINSHVPPPATVMSTEHGVGWVCPFIKGDQASDRDMCDALINIYNRSGRIVVDATAPRNFVKTPPPDTQVVCVDIGMALQMERREDAFFSGKIRRQSVVSLKAWRELNAEYTPFFQTAKATYPETVDTVKALLFIKNNRPDIFDVSFLQKDHSLLIKFSAAYDRQGIQDALSQLDKYTPAGVVITPEEIKEAKSILNTERPITLDNIKESCIKELERYINSRGLINRSGEFEPSLITKIFRDTQLTVNKVEAAKDLIEKINKAGSLKDLDSVIKDTFSTPDILKATFSSGLGSSLGKCLVILATANKSPELNLSEKSAPKI